MKIKLTKIILFCTLCLIGLSNNAKGQIANSYPNDVGIESDLDVLYVEKFDSGLTTILSHYDDILNSAGMSLDNDVPPGSLGPNSIKMTNIGGTNTGGHLYKKFTPGWDSTVYIRYYVKYPSISNGYIHHESVWFGGYNPATPWPNPQAGTCGLGSSRLGVAYEPVWEGNPPGMDCYLYWGDMHSWNGGTSCYGNPMITQGRLVWTDPPSPTSPYLTWDQWMCVEVMVKLNNPVTEYNGELRIWQDGVQVGYWGPGFPNGHWTTDKWYNNPSDPPFPGFRWRTDASLNINYIWIEYYDDTSPNGVSHYINYDHLVIAKQYIGPIYNATGLDNNPNASLAIRIYPNPATDAIYIGNIPASKKPEYQVFNNIGQLTKQGTLNDSTIVTTGLKSGLYFVCVATSKERMWGKFIKE